MVVVVGVVVVVGIVVGVVIAVSSSGRVGGVVVRGEGVLVGVVLG